MDQWVTDAFFSYFPSYSNQIKKKENVYTPSNYQIGSSNENERQQIRKRQVCSLFLYKKLLIIIKKYFQSYIIT